MISVDDAAGHLYSLTHTDSAQLLLSIMPVAMIVIDTRGRIQAFSKAAEDLFGYCEADLLGRNVNILMSQPHRARHDSYIARYLETGEKRIMGGPRLENARHADGHTFPIELTVGETHDEGAHLFLGFVRALSKPEFEQRQIGVMLAELAHTSRVSAMGALATAIAHVLLTEGLWSREFVGDFKDGRNLFVAGRTVDE
ncbi:MAG TPA: PAS domain S-box protein, partial [Novosphingobium sp.]|nr:PAS domain S-box protein [Novosphingobium sp.]